MIQRTVGNWAGWPLCPQCDARREAQCPVCLAHGTDFRLADFEEPDDAEAVGDGADVLLLCSTCDEPFMPRFYRRCAECAFDIGEGIERPAIVPDEMNPRAILVMVGMMLLLCGLLAFFAFVLR